MKNRFINATDMTRIMRVSEPDDRAVWVICSDTGFRIDDILSLRQWQVDRALKPPFLLEIKEKKTGKSRTVTLSDNCVRAFKLLSGNIVHRHPLAYFFQSRSRHGDRKKIHRSTVFRHFNRVLKCCGFDTKGYTVHSLRKVYAHNAYTRTGSLLRVKADLNHDKVETTMLYVSDLQL